MKCHRCGPERRARSCPMQGKRRTPQAQAGDTPATNDGVSLSPGVPLFGTRASSAQTHPISPNPSASCEEHSHSCALPSAQPESARLWRTLGQLSHFPADLNELSLMRAIMVVSQGSAVLIDCGARSNVCGSYWSNRPAEAAAMAGRPCLAIRHVRQQVMISGVGDQPNACSNMAVHLFGRAANDCVRVRVSSRRVSWRWHTGTAGHGQPTCAGRGNRFHDPQVLLRREQRLQDSAQPRHQRLWLGGEHQRPLHSAVRRIVCHRRPTRSTSWVQQQAPTEMLSMLSATMLITTRESATLRRYPTSSSRRRQSRPRDGVGLAAPVWWKAVACCTRVMDGSECQHHLLASAVKHRHPLDKHHRRRPALLPALLTSVEASQTQAGTSMKSGRRLQAVRSHRPRVHRLVRKRGVSVAAKTMARQWLFGLAPSA